MLGMATIQGTLLHLGDYPGLIQGEGIVHGELYELPIAALDRIDELEGFDPLDPGSSLFLRVDCSVRLDGNSTPLQACTYVWPHDATATTIPEGDWVNFLQTTRGGYPPVPWL